MRMMVMDLKDVRALAVVIYILSRPCPKMIRTCFMVEEDNAQDEIIVNTLRRTNPVSVASVLL